MKFSPIETIVLKILGKRKLPISDVAAAYGWEADIHSYDANAVVASAIRRINKKCKYHKLDWYIAGKGLGRGGRTVWKEKR